MGISKKARLEAATETIWNPAKGRSWTSDSHHEPCKIIQMQGLRFSVQGVVRVQPRTLYSPSGGTKVIAATAVPGQAHLTPGATW